MTRAASFALLAVAGCVAVAAEPTPASKRPAADAGARDARGPQLLPPGAGKAQLISDIREPPYKPTLPADLNVNGMVVWGLFKVCVTTEGTVSEVKIIKSADKSVDDSWVAKLKSWRYRPYVFNGHPVPFCYPLRLEVRSRR
jgi:outer membrane biosynthesis protein TonB